MPLHRSPSPFYPFFPSPFSIISDRSPANLYQVQGLLPGPLRRGIGEQGRQAFQLRPGIGSLSALDF